MNAASTTKPNPCARYPPSLFPKSLTRKIRSNNDALDLSLLSRFELPERDSVLRFLRSLSAYNVLRKPALVAWAPAQIALYDLSANRELRRLDIDLQHPSLHALDRLNLLASNGSSDHAPLFDRALDRETLTPQFFEPFR